MPGYGGKMRTFRPPEEGMPFGIALVWAMVDLPLVFGLRVQQVVVGTCQQWERVVQRECAKRHKEKSSDDRAN